MMQADISPCINTEEGRIRWANKRNSTTGAIYYAFEYDYYLRDHLGNVRTVLTEGKDTTTYAATMETADSAVVRALFSNVYDPVRTVSTKPANFDTDNNNHNVSLLTGGTGGRIGPSMVLKVMAGDKVQISTFAFFNITTQPPVTDNTLLTDLLSTLVSGVTAQSGGKITSGGSTQLSNTVSPNILSFLNSRTYNSSLPKAYLNWVLLDDQFKYVAGNMGAMQVQAGSSKQALVAPLQTIVKNGYLYIYVSNQSPQNVYFDDLVIKHYTGPLLQEQSYYPFGLEMAGISDQAMGKLDSKNKFNGGVELEEDYGVNLYSTFYRKYDPQIGRFSGVDCQSEASIGMSVYQFAGNNPVMLNDPLGNKMTAGLWDRGNGYYDFPGEHHQQQSADPLAGTFMDAGDNGGGGWGGAGGGGGGDYSRYWSNILHEVNSGDDLNGFEKGDGRFLYQYTNSSGSGIFVTPNNDGVATNQDGEDYHLTGGFTETTYTISSASFDNTYPNYNFMGSNFSFADINIVPFSESADHTFTNSFSDWGIIRSSSYAGVHQSNKDVGIINHNSTYTDGKLTGQSLSLLNTFTGAYNADNLSLTLGVNILGFEIHLGPTLYGGVTLGASYSDRSGITGGDATFSIGQFLSIPLGSPSPIPLIP